MKIILSNEDKELIKTVSKSTHVDSSKLELLYVSTLHRNLFYDLTDLVHENWEQLQ